MCSGVGCFWALLSAGLLAACAAAFLSPAWLLPPGRAAAGFGLLWRCAGPPRGCHGSAGPGGFGDIPSGSWQTSAVLCAGGCALLALSSLLAIVAVLLPGGACERRVCTLAGYMQTAAVFIMASGLLVYPFGFNSATVKRFCENSDIYYAGDCQIGWGYMLAIVGVMLSVFYHSLQNMHQKSTYLQLQYLLFYSILLLFKNRTFLSTGNGQKLL